MGERFVAGVAPKDPALRTDENGAMHGTAFKVVKDMIAPEGAKSRIGKNGERECSPRFRGLFLGVSETTGEGCHRVTADGDHFYAGLAIVLEGGPEGFELLEAVGAAYPEEKLYQDGLAPEV